VVVQREDNHETVFLRQSQELLSVWLKDYSIGELWEKNILGGRPHTLSLSEISTLKTTSLQ
jgi:hypothetical protein